MWFCFFGFLIVFADTAIALPATGGTIELIPAFLGYLLLLFGSRRMNEESTHFRRLGIVALAALPLGLAEFILNILSVPVAPLILFILTTVADLWCAYEFSEASKEIEHDCYTKLGADKLSTSWFLLVMTSLLGFALPLLPKLSFTQFVIHHIALILFLVCAFLFTRKLQAYKRKKK